MSRYCSGCGAPAADEGAFCTKCGSALAQPDAEAQAVPDVATKAASATADMAGRSCPYCRFPLKEGGEVESCPSCKAIHHADCWQENDGCAVNGCGAKALAGQAAGVATAATTVLPPSTYAAGPGAQPAYSQAAQSPWPTADTNTPAQARGPRREAWKVAIVALAILATLGGSATALVISTSANGSSADTSTTDTYTDTTSDYTDTTTDYTDTTTDYTETTTTDDTTTDYTAGTYGADGPEPYSGDKAGIATAAREVITDHHDYLSTGDYNDAWQEFSPRYRQRKVGDLNDNGESYADGDMETSPTLWDSDMGNEFPGSIDTSGLHVQVVKAMGDDDALVRVRGMTYTKGGVDCPYNGLTWVHYEDAKWWYDPGTNHHPERRNEFGNGSTATELLRGRC